jgi:predicted DNA-binding protein YlxM (UPF0122 family)
MMVKSNLFSVLGVVIAVSFWFFDSSIHYFVYGEEEFEFIPAEFNELWMRVVIVSMVILFGLFADYHLRKLIAKERELQAARIYGSMIRATHHILNNLLNQLQLFRMEAMKSRDFDRDILQYYDKAIDEANDLVKKLSRIDDVTDENIAASVEPGRHGTRSTGGQNADKSIVR